MPIVLVGALLLAACGSDGDGAAAEQNAGSVGGQATGQNDSEAPADAPKVTSGAVKGTGADEPGQDTGRGAAAAALPDVEVVRVTKGGDKVNLRSLHVAGKPTLLWFWAPHCPVCKAEAPDLLRFNAEHGEKMTILGVGAQDDLKLAESFCAETRTTPLEMVWDSSGKSWLHYKVTNQPTVIVLDQDGKVVKRWFRNFDEQGILKAAGQG